MKEVVTSRSSQKLVIARIEFPFSIQGISAADGDVETLADAIALCTSCISSTITLSELRLKYIGASWLLRNARPGRRSGGSFRLSYSDSRSVLYKTIINGGCQLHAFVLHIHTCVLQHDVEALT